MQQYNSNLPKLVIPEYGRNIQSMIEYCCSIENREERNTCAKAIIQVMGQVNPHLRDSGEHSHKLWDHMFIISKFNLDVDSPYPKPSVDIFKEKPEKPDYPKGKIRYKHYGKTMEEIIKHAINLNEGDEKNVLTKQIANHLKKSYFNWNKDNITDDVVIKNLLELSHGKLKLDENTVLSSHKELSGNSNKKFFHKNNKHKHKHKHKHKN
ncbi:MAG: DUF4290 domain-containing protein [Bacteroidetes bacterium]|nr:DUF4290 domain-containing protein [Bacteroidota bacterium]